MKLYLGAAHTPLKEILERDGGRDGGVFKGKEQFQKQCLYRFYVCAGMLQIFLCAINQDFNINWDHSDLKNTVK